MKFVNIKIIKPPFQGGKGLTASLVRVIEMALRCQLSLILPVNQGPEPLEVHTWMSPQDHLHEHKPAQPVEAAAAARSAGVSSTADSSNAAIGANVRRASSLVGLGRLGANEGSSSGASQQGTSQECVPTVAAAMTCLMGWAVCVCQRMTPHASATASGGRNSGTKEYIWILLFLLLIRSKFVCICNDCIPVLECMSFNETMIIDDVKHQWTKHCNLQYYQKENRTSVNQPVSMLGETQLMLGSMWLRRSCGYLMNLEPGESAAMITEKGSRLSLQECVGNSGISVSAWQIAAIAASKISMAGVMNSLRVNSLYIVNSLTVNSLVGSVRAT